MAIPGQTGQGATITLTGIGASTCVRSVTLPNFTMETLDVSCITDTLFAKKAPTDLVDAGEVEITVLYDGSLTIPNGDQETLTVTIPPKDTNGTATTISGTGFVSGATGGTAAIGQLMEQTLTFVFDGDVGPTVS